MSSSSYLMDLGCPLLRGLSVQRLRRFAATEAEPYSAVCGKVTSIGCKRLDVRLPPADFPPSSFTKDPFYKSESVFFSQKTIIKISNFSEAKKSRN